MKTIVGPIIRSLGLSDIDMLLRAQNAASNELDAMDPCLIGAALTNGQIQGLVLEGEGRTMLVAWQREGQSALLSVLYREGVPKGFLTDARALLERTEGILREFGVTRVYCALSIFNGNYERLVSLYHRLGFAPDLVRFGKEI